MAKTNYTKVEDALNEGIHKMTVSNLLDLTKSEASSQIEGLQLSPADQKQLIAALSFEANHSKDKQLFKEGGLTRQELKGLLDSPERLNKEEWLKLQDFQEKVVAYKKTMEARKPKDADETLVEAQRKKHINKRYNTREQWLPLH